MLLSLFVCLVFVLGINFMQKIGSTVYTYFRFSIKIVVGAEGKMEYYISIVNIYTISMEPLPLDMLPEHENCSSLLL